MNEDEVPTKVEPRGTSMQVTPLAAECQLCGEQIMLADASYANEEAMMTGLMVQLDKHNETCPKLQENAS